MRDITKERFADGKPLLRRYHQARWDEPLIFELSSKGERGILPPEVEKGIRDKVGDVLGALPEGMRREQPPALPEISQPQVLRHYVRLSQQTLGADFNIDVGQGTCTMKYSPKVNEDLARNPHAACIHPYQADETVQGVLEIMYRFEQILKEVSGMDRFSMQPGAGSAAIYASASIIRKYHEMRGEGDTRDEIITTSFSHPSDAACAKVAGYKIITLPPDRDGYPDFEALKAAISQRTAGLLMTNPEDTGIFNPDIKDFVDLAHEKGALCFYDQANANGILGITRSREAGFDLCHFNLHKTFSTPHGCGGPAAGALGVTEELAQFLPTPVVACDNGAYRLDYDRPNSIGKVGAFHGSAGCVIRAYAWAMSLGADGMKTAAEVAVLNNNYFLKKVLEIPGATAPYAPGKYRIEQVRYSWEELTKDTGVHSEELGVRAADYGVHYWTSHHPFVIPEPMTLEPTESYTRAELDEYVEILHAVAQEARDNPDKIKKGPYNCPIHQVDHDLLDDPNEWAITWRAYQKKKDK